LSSFADKALALPVDVADNFLHLRRYLRQLLLETDPDPFQLVVAKTNGRRKAGFGAWMCN
jgi:hypothetical protein